MSTLYLITLYPCLLITFTTALPNPKDKIASLNEVYDQCQTVTDNKFCLGGKTATTSSEGQGCLKDKDCEVLVLGQRDFTEGSQVIWTLLYQQDKTADLKHHVIFYFTNDSMATDTVDASGKFMMRGDILVMSNGGLHVLDSSHDFGLSAGMKNITSILMNPETAVAIDGMQCVKFESEDTIQYPALPSPATISLDVRGPLYPVLIDLRVPYDTSTSTNVVDKAKAIKYSADMVQMFAREKLSPDVMETEPTLLPRTSKPKPKLSSGQMAIIFFSSVAAVMIFAAVTGLIIWAVAKVTVRRERRREALPAQ